MGQTDLQPIYLKDYQPPPFLVEGVELEFDLDPDRTVVTSRVAYRRNPAADRQAAGLALNGEKIVLRRLLLDGAELPRDAYDVTDDQLLLHAVPEAFTLTVETECVPRANTALEGLYLSGGRFCTQCEPEGFRRITYFLDRPDVLAPFKVRMTADGHTYPLLLSNGNRVSTQTLENGRCIAEWEDPFPKPCYLFALVAGDLAHIGESFTTSSGKSVAVNIYVEPGKERQSEYAMDCLLRAMKWDEDVYGLEYDLDEFNVVAVSDFNMGAMENKSLNIFNDKLLLADPDTATDDDYARIESVVAHEYFHNWTGNRITCRDWFQLSLKEGLTVFRDQQFSADARSAAVQRINDVSTLRMTQFPEDQGPLAHPVRPDSYAEINNFYTYTVYEKGAEVVRMIHTLIGSGAYRKGMDLYFTRHDGQAVTCEDFVAAMQDASGKDLSQFLLWYNQAGTPLLEAESALDEIRETLSVTLSQKLSPTPGQTEKQPMHIPVALGIVDSQYGSVKSKRRGDNGEFAETHIVSLMSERETIELETERGTLSRAVVSLNRGFSAPIDVRASLSPSDLAMIAKCDPDPYARWNAQQELALTVLLGELTRNDVVEARTLLVDGVRAAVARAYEDPAQITVFLALPSARIINQRLEAIDPLAVHQTRHALRVNIAKELREDFLNVYETLSDRSPFSPDAIAAGRRALRNAALHILTLAQLDEPGLAYQHFKQSDNMTDRWAALAALNDTDTILRRKALNEFASRYSDNPLVLDKWLSLEALHSDPAALDRVRELLDHPNYDSRNPNRIRALLATFAFNNDVAFHRKDGEGYRFIADQVMKIDQFNPQSAARLAGAFQQWARYREGYKAGMRDALERMSENRQTSQDVREIVEKSLSA